MNNRGGAGILLAMLLATTSACNKEATGQSIAVVNGEEVSESELNEELAAANVPESADKKEILPQLLQRIIERRLVAQKATEEGIDRSPEYLSRQRRMNEQLLIGLYTQRQADSLKAPTPAETQAFIARSPNIFQQRQILTLDQLSFERPADMSILQQLQNDHSLDAVANTLARLGIPITKGNGRLDTATVPAQLAQQITSLPPGEPFVAPSGNRVIVSVVTGRTDAPLTQEEARRVATEAVRRQKLQELVEGQVKELRTKAQITYQPGYEPKADQPKAGEPAAPAKAGG